MTKPIFEHKTYAKNESEITRAIEAYRIPNGDVELRISAEGEWDDEPISLHKTLSAEEVEKLGRVLLCFEESVFDDLIERASKFGGDSR